MRSRQQSDTYEMHAIYASSVSRAGDRGDFGTRRCLPTAFASLAPENPILSYSMSDDESVENLSVTNSSERCTTSEDLHAKKLSMENIDTVRSGNGSRLFLEPVRVKSRGRKALDRLSFASCQAILCALIIEANQNPNYFVLLVRIDDIRRDVVPVVETIVAKREIHSTEKATAEYVVDLLIPVFLKLEDTVQG